MTKFYLTIALWLALAGSALAGLSNLPEATCRIRRGSSLGSGCAFARFDEAGKAAANGRFIHVLTNAHVAGRAGTAVAVEFWRNGYKSIQIRGEVLRSYYLNGYHRDIAVVQVDSAHLGGYVPKIVPLAHPNDPVDFRAIASIGCPRGGWPTMWKGQGLGGSRSSGDVLYFKPAPENGRSGSAVFDLAGTKIIGLIAWSSGKGGTGHGIAMTHREIWAAFSGKGRVYGTGTKPAHHIETPVSCTPAELIQAYGEGGGLVAIQRIQTSYCVHGVTLAQYCPQCPSPNQRWPWNKPAPRTPPAPKVPQTPYNPFPGSPQPILPSADYVTRTEFQKLTKAAEGIRKGVDGLTAKIGELETSVAKRDGAVGKQFEEAKAATAEFKTILASTETSLRTDFKAGWEEERQAVATRSADLDARFATRDDLARERETGLLETVRGEFRPEIDSALGKVTERLDGLGGGITMGKVVVGSLGLSGPLALAAIAGTVILRRRLKRRIEEWRDPGPGGGPSDGFPGSPHRRVVYEE